MRLVGARRAQKVLSKYLEAIRLEYAVDSLYHSHFRIQGVARLVPHGFAILKYIRKYQRLITLAVPPFIAIWCLFLQPLYVLLLALKWCARLAEVEREQLSGDIYLASSNERNVSFASVDDSLYPCAVITLPFKPATKAQLRSCRRVDLRSISSIGLLLRAACYGLRINWKVLFSKDRKLALYTYTAFYWFWAYLALEKSRIRTLWISNHYDRWTALASSLPDVNVILVQHGRLYHGPKNGGRLCLVLSRKIANVKRIYALDQESETYFRKYIEDTDLEFVRLHLKSELIEWRSAGTAKFKILVIGNSGDLSFHNQLLNHLTDRYAKDADVAYRYHPLQRGRISDKLIVSGTVWELASSDCIPKADLVVSYGSSLDEEIATLSGSQVLTYDWEADIDVGSVIYEIERRIKSAFGKPKADISA